MYRKHAYQAAGMQADSFYAILHRDPEFARLCEEAEAIAVANKVALINKAAAEGSWQAAAWSLERRYPELYGRKIAHEVSGSVNVDAKEIADKVAKEFGLDPDAVLQEADEIIQDYLAKAKPTAKPRKG